MKAYLNNIQAVIDMHTRGYSNDFELIGNDLLWIQQKIFIRENEFSFVECHYFNFHCELKKEVILFGVVASKYNVKGILMNHYNTYTEGTPLVIARKIRKLFCSLEQKDKKKSYTFENN